MSFENRFINSNVWIKYSYQLCLVDTSGYISWMAKNRNLGLGQRFVMLFIYFSLLQSLKIPRIILSQTVFQTGKACFQWCSVPLICQVIIITLQIKHTNILSQQQNVISGCDKMLVWSDVFVIHCRWDKMSVWLSARSNVRDKLLHDTSWHHLSKLLSDSTLDYECCTSAKVTVSLCIWKVICLCV
jgi:hypothetical protein